VDDELDAEDLLDEAIDAEEDGDLDRALALLDPALALDSVISEGWTRRASILLQLGRQEEALPSADRALAADPEDAWARNCRGDALRALGLGRDALANTGAQSRSTRSTRRLGRGWLQLSST
jgi:tetratricopeptide (TPR) repeat protein